MRRIIVLILIVLVLLTWLDLADPLARDPSGLPRANAQTGGGYDLTWSTVDAGGGVSNGGGNSLSGTAGQPDASARSSNNGYTLTGGFWHTITQPHSVYLPLVLRGP